MSHWICMPSLAVLVAVMMGGCNSSEEVVTAGAESVYAKAQAGDMNEVGAAIRRGFDVNEPDENGKTVLHYAIEGNHPELVEMLLEEFRADVRVADSAGHTAIDYARASGNPQIMTILEDSQ